MKRILVIRSGAIGDTLLLLPFLKDLERRHPGVEIGLAGKPERLRLLASQLGSSRVYDLDKDFAWLFIPEASAPERESRLLRSQDWIVRFAARPGDVFDENLRRLGCRRLNSVAALPPEDYRRHAAFYPFDALDLPTSAETLNACLGEWFSPERRESPPLGAASRSAPGEFAPAVVFCPGAGGREKRWPLECWARLLEAFLARSSKRVILLAGPAEEGEPLECLREHREERVALVRNLPLGDLPLLLRRAQAYVGHDSGVTHLAAMLGVATLALFGPTDPGRWGPLGRRAWVFQGSNLLRYPQWIEGIVSQCPTRLEAIAPEAVLTWLEDREGEGALLLRP